MTYEEWISDHLRLDVLCGWRVGQSYMNRVLPGENNPKLFYEEDKHKAMKMIAEMEKTND